MGAVLNDDALYYQQFSSPLDLTGYTPLTASIFGVDAGGSLVCVAVRKSGNRQSPDSLWTTTCVPYVDNGAAPPSSGPFVTPTGWTPPTSGSGSDTPPPPTYTVATAANPDATINNGFNSADAELWALSQSFPSQEDGSILLIYRYDANTMALKGTISTDPESGITAAQMFSGPSSNDVSNGKLIGFGTATTPSESGDQTGVALFVFDSATNTLSQVVKPFGADTMLEASFIDVSTSNPVVIAGDGVNTTIYQLNSSTYAIEHQTTLTGVNVAFAVGPSFFELFFVDSNNPNVLQLFNLSTQAVSTVYTNANPIQGLMADETVHSNLWIIDEDVHQAIQLSADGTTATGVTADLSLSIPPYKFDNYNRAFWGMYGMGQGYVGYDGSNGSLYGIIDEVQTPQIQPGTIQFGLVTPFYGANNLIMQGNLANDSGGSDWTLFSVPVADRRTS